MARKARRVLARRRRELEGLVPRGRPAGYFDPIAAADAALGEPGVDQLESARSAEDDRARARAIPIIGRVSGGGAIPGTRPGAGRLGSWSGR
jgi:hypothetical protein